MASASSLGTGDLTPIERALLWYLQVHSRVAISRRELIKAAGGDDSPTGDRAIDVHIVSLRKKVGRDRIRTIRGKGYMYQP